MGEFILVKHLGKKGKMAIMVPLPHRLPVSEGRFGRAENGAGTPSLLLEERGGPPSSR